MKFGQLEALPSKGPKQEHQQERHQDQQQEQPRQETGPPKDHEYDDRYDILRILTINPNKAKVGFVLTVELPTRRTHQENIPAGTQSGYRFVVRGTSGIRRPDNKNGNFWVELEIPEPARSSAKEDF